MNKLFNNAGKILKSSIVVGAISLTTIITSMTLFEPTPPVKAPSRGGFESEACGAVFQGRDPDNRIYAEYDFEKDLNKENDYYKSILKDKLIVKNKSTKLPLTEEHLPHAEFVIDVYRKNFTTGDYERIMTMSTDDSMIHHLGTLYIGDLITWQDKPSPGSIGNINGIYDEFIMRRPGYMYNEAAELGHRGYCVRLGVLRKAGLA